MREQSKTLPDKFWVARHRVYCIAMNIQCPGLWRLHNNLDIYRIAVDCTSVSKQTLLTMLEDVDSYLILVEVLEGLDDPALGP